ncbi:MAG: hypothetical protein OEY22_03435 [Candidatus Bathyarchaeota archaeon]|nr:hypothetical protein [Candidatus Bathyarchaeota archaeon]MDH5787813.1 hypothetical protein [Candidatus Bathyarchaeota archaeon]
MGKKFSKEQFLKLAEELLQGGPKVKYQNPDAWTNYKQKEMLEEETKKKQFGHTEDLP